MSFKPPRRPQFFYTTAPLPCPYVPGRTERKVVTEITGAEAESLHDKLSRAGFRRSHNIAYAPVCPGCNSCVPIRIPVAEFGPLNATIHAIDESVELACLEPLARVYQDAAARIFGS